MITFENLRLACICLLAFLAVFGIIWSFRQGIANRIARDVQWYNNIRRATEPDAPDGTRIVIWSYLIHCCVVLPLLCWLVPIPMGGIVIWLAMFTVPQILADRHWKKHLEKIDEQLPQTIGKMASLISAGLSPADALRQLAVETDAPIRYEFAIMSREWQMGANLPAIFASAFSRLKLESFRLLCAAITANNKMGGNLVEVLQGLSSSLFNQMETNREIEAAMSEGKMTIKALLLAPVIMLTIITFIDTQAVMMFFQTGLGLAIFAIAMVLIGIAYLWARRIANIAV